MPRDSPRHSIVVYINLYLPIPKLTQIAGIRPYIESGQIIATSHDRFPPNGGLVREIPIFQENPGW